MSHEWTEKFVQHRVADPRILRLIHKWLKAGVSEDGEWSETKVGTPPGAVISPLLANIYLHYVFDQWIDAWRKQAKGEVIVVRYADDLVVGFEHREDAERFLEEFRERLAKFGLELHPEKTRLIEFGRWAESNRRKRGEGKPQTFDFLGFTHYCGYKKGRFVVWRKTAGKRMRAKLQQLKQELRRRMPEPLAQVAEWLGKVQRGYYQYHAVPDNSAALGRFRHRLFWLWWRVVGRRSERRMRWDRYCSIFDLWVPYPRILHPYPSVRFDAMHPR
jgi:group II intron reverse transcriptase/maturase